MKRCARDNVFKTINVMLDYKIETRKKVFKAILPSELLSDFQIENVSSTFPSEGSKNIKK